MAYYHIGVTQYWFNSESGDDVIRPTSINKNGTFFFTFGYSRRYALITLT